MKTLLLAYASVYALALITTGFVGMVLYLREADQLRVIWRVVAPILVVAQAWNFVRYLRERPKLLVEAPEMGEKGAAWLELVLGTLMVPSSMIDMAYAYA